MSTEKSEESGSSTSSGKVAQYSFLTMSSQDNHVASRSSLFPSAKTTSCSINYSQNEDWLENKSFTSDTAHKVVQFQEELKKLQKHGPDIIESLENGQLKPAASDPENNIDGTNLTLTDPNIHTRDRTQQRSSDDSDYDSYHGYRKKKKSRKHSSEDDNTVSHGKKKKKHKHSKKLKKDKHKSKESKDVERELPGIFESSKIFMDDIADIAPDHAFKLDRAPDKNSWLYCSLYSGHVAHYRPACNQCVGTQGSQTVYMKDREKKRKEKVSTERYYSKENRKIIKRAPVDVITTVKSTNAHENSATLTKTTIATALKYERAILDSAPAYIPVIQYDQSAINSECKDIRQKILDDSTSLYVIGRGKPADKVDLEQATVDPVRLKVAEYNKKLREAPNDVGLWLEFVRAQDQIATDDSGDSSLNGNESDSRGKRSTTKGVLEKKLSIVDKALESNPGDIDLLQVKIELSSEVWDSVVVNKELEKLLRVHAANTALWKYYLTFNQSKLSTFTVTKLTKCYHKCLRTLFGILEGKVHTHHVPENLELEILEIILQYYYFLKQTGYKEKAVASFQALLEYNLLPPSSLADVAKETKMAAFEGFWDGSCPRIGTCGALGWKKWTEHAGADSVQDLRDSNIDSFEALEESIMEKKLPKHMSWLAIETLREEHHWLPWQPGKDETEEDCEDVERLVVFDDISPVLFNISQKYHFQFIISFLKFLGFEPNGRSDQTPKHSGIFCENVNDIAFGYKSSISRDLLNCPNNEMVRNYTIEMLNQIIPYFSDINRSTLTLVLIETQLSKYTGKNLPKSDKKDMKKILKNILKEEKCRHDLSVWSAYIDLERLVGKTGEAENVIETALSMYSGVSIETSDQQSVGLISLYTQYCELLLGMNQNKPCELLPRTSEVTIATKKKVLSVISCLVESGKFNPKSLSDPSGATVLKTLSKLSRLCTASNLLVCHDGASSSSKDHWVKLIWCHSLFVYCKSDLKSSLDIYSAVISTLCDNDKCLLELGRELCMYKLKLIVYHMSITSSPLCILREHLDAALQKYPDSAVFLSLFTDIERKSRISGRLNLHFDRWCRTVEDPAPAVQAVLFQLNCMAKSKNSDDNSVNTSGLVYRTRVWLEHSLSLRNLQHCPLLWRLYMQLEKQAGDAGRLKGVFYRAVQQCPWAKSIYMDGVRLFGADQLQEMVDLMTEKELRVQIPVEELDILMSP